MSKTNTSSSVPSPVASAKSSGEGNAIPDGWRGLDDLPTEGEPIEGLLTSGEIVEAEWWGPVPPELHGPDGWDGSGWAFDGSRLSNYGMGRELAAWRHPLPSERDLAAPSDQAPDEPQ